MSAYQIRESKRARRIRLQVTVDDGLVVVAPKGVRPEEVDILVRSQHQWINRALKKLADRKQYLSRQFGEGPPTTISLPAINKTWRVSYFINTDLAAGWDVSAHDSLNIYSEPSSAQMYIEKWLTSVARDHLHNELSLLSKKTGLSCKRMQIRAQKSRWGSYSARGTISLNRNILFFQPAVVQYLLIHELCHTIHLNHSRDFWKLVETFCPDFRALDKSLKDAWRLLPPWSVK
ncbi:MAG: M48 family metallopeptidase [Acidiferrobacterales bacterium]